jgi:hypothetical protein
MKLLLHFGGLIGQVRVFSSLYLEALDTRPELRNNFVSKVISLTGRFVELSPDGVDEVLKVVLNNTLLR